jgi:GNAT superfamily N-acetyltransferase
MIALGCRFSEDSAEMDRPRIHRWLSTESYWALGRTRELHDRAMDGSRNFGMFDVETGEQVAYARVITDGATFAWLCDVFVSDDVRGRGVGVALIQWITDRLEPLALKRMALVTADAHGLYEKFGFESLAEPERWMARLRE